MSVRIEVVQIGNEKQPLVIIDNAVEDPSAFQEIAAESQFSVGGPFYPGVRAPVPNFLHDDMVLPFAQIFQDVFGYQDGLTVRECNYSIVTTPIEALTPIQTMPHFDGVEPDTLAVLLYLCPASHGGTAFFRHRVTGYETITADRLDHFQSVLHAEIDDRGLPPQDYVRGDTQLFERTYMVEAAFNRMIIYRGITLHSGIPASKIERVIDTRKGRLTVNMFVIKP